MVFLKVNLVVSQKSCRFDTLTKIVFGRIQFFQRCCHTNSKLLTCQLTRSSFVYSIIFNNLKQ